MSFGRLGVVIVLPSELRELGLFPEGKAVLAIGQPAFTHSVRLFLELDTPVRVSRDVEGADLDCEDLYGVVTELLLPGLSGIGLVRELAKNRPEIHTLLVTHDPIRCLPSDITHMAGPIDRVRLIRALTGA